MSGGGSRTATTTTDNAPWIGQQPFITEGYNRARGWLDAPAAQFYPGQTVAPQSWATNEAQNRAINFGNSAGYNTALSGTMATARGDFLNPNSNPAFQGMLTDTINAIRPGVDSAFAASGRLGSGAHANAFSDAATRAGTALAYDNYGRERANQIQAQGMLPGLTALPNQYMAAAGAGQDAYAQSQIDADVARWDYNQNADYAKLANYMQLLGNIVPGTQTTTQRGGGGNNGLQMAGLGIGALGGLGSFGQGFAAAAPFLGLTPSDARIKEDIRPVGELDNGLPVYAYRYKGRPETHIGLLAQDVAQVKPKAVGHIGGGILGVDYAAATS